MLALFLAIAPRSTLVSREASRFIFEAYYTYRDTLKPFKLLDNDNVTATLEGRSHRGKVIPPLDLNGAELERLLAAGQVAIELKRDQRRVFVPLDSGHITRIPDPLPKDRPGHAKNGLKSTLGRLQPMSDSSDNDGNEDVQNFKRRRFDAEDHGVDMDIPVKGKEPDSLFIADKPDNKLGLLAPLYSSPGLKRFLDQVDHDMLADAIQESVRQKTWDLERKFKSQAAEVNELRDDARTLRLENARLKASSVGMSSRSPSPLARQSSRDQFSPFEGDDSSESHVGPSSSTLRKTAPLKKKEPEKRNVRPESEHRGLAVVIPEAINRNFSAGTDEARDYAAHWKARKGPLEKLVKRWNERHGNFVSKINGTEESAKYKVHPVYEEAVVGLVLGKLAEHVRKAKTASESTQPVDTAPVQTFKEEQQVKQDQKVKEEPIEIIDDDDDNMEEVARQLAAHEARLETPHNGSAADQGEPTKACPICTYENPLTFLMCDVCGSEIP